MTLIEFIETKLSECHDRYYYEDAPEGESFPYITYDLSYYDDSYKEDCMLDISVWQKEKEGVNYTRELDGICDTIDAKFKNINYADDDITVNIRRVDGMFRRSVPDPNPKIKRRLLQYHAKNFKKG